MCGVIPAASSSIKMSRSYGQSAIENWVAKVGRAGIDGAKLISSAKQLVAKYAMMARP
jgi:hypothetical protein